MSSSMYCKRGMCGSISPRFLFVRLILKSYGYSARRYFTVPSICICVISLWISEKKS